MRMFFALAGALCLPIFAQAQPVYQPPQAKYTFQQAAPQSLSTPTVTLPAPRVNVQDAAPEVAVQPAPAVNVAVPPAAVNIQQQAPIVTLSPAVQQFQAVRQFAAPIQYDVPVQRLSYSAPVVERRVFTYSAPVVQEIREVRTQCVVQRSPITTTTVERRGLFGNRTITTTTTR